MQEKLLNTVKLQIYLCFKSAMGTAVSYLSHAKTDEVISKTKKVDRNTKHPFPVKVDLDTFSVLLVLIKLLVIVYDVVSTPFYALYMQPWAKRAANRAIRARQEDPTDPYSPYVSAVKVEPRVLEHYLYKAETIAHFQKLTLESNDRKQPALGKRQLFSVSEVLTRTGRKMTKLSLDDHYSWLSLEQVDQTIGHLANGFLTQGVQYQEKVLIFAETRMEWFLCAQACFRIGAVVTTLYATLGLEGIVHSFQDTEVEHVVTTEDLLPSLLKVINRIPKVRHITVIQLHHALLLKQGKVGQADFDNATQADGGRKVTLTTYDQLLDIGQQSPLLEYTSPKADDVAVILFTSGSTGNPKGVVQTHGNFIAEFKSLFSMINNPLLDAPNSHTFYAFLPLAHTLELVCELFFFGAGARLAYGHPTTMTDDGTSITAGQLGDLRVAQPTFLAGVPLILDRIRKSLATKLESRSIFWTQLFKYACAYKNFWLGLGYDTPIVNRLVCKRVQAQLGGRVKFIFCGGAPLSADTQKVMKAFLNIKIMIGYGSTETCGAVLMTDLNDNSVGRVGGPMAGQKVRLIDWPEGGYSVHDKPRPRGEIVIGSASITKGYYRLPEQTAETYEVTEDGTRWVKMGDIGEVYPNGTFKIIDRRKDLVKMQYGEYVSLGKVEAELKNFKFAENVCVYGDSMKMYTVVFISPSIAALRKLAISLGKAVDLPLEALCADEDIVSAVTKELLQFGAEAGLNKMEIPQRVKLCSEEWSVKSGFLTASLKINRQNIRTFYQADIERMYKQ